MQDESLQQSSLDAIAEALAQRIIKSPDGVVGERKDLEPASVQAFSSLFGDRVDKSRKVAIPHWESVGHVDLLVRSNEDPLKFSWLAELKWSGPGRGVLYEGVWDLFKMALGTLRSERPRAYLITGAPAAVWRSSGFADLFDDKQHDPVDLCLRDTGGRDQRLAWDELLYGGDDRYPDRVPARLRTAVAGRAPVGEFELRAAEVTIIGDEWIPFGGGWPHGHRPSDARRPIHDVDAEHALEQFKRHESAPGDPDAPSDAR